MLNQYKFEDGMIKGVKINNSNTVEVTFCLWDDKLINIIFNNYYKLKDNNSINIDIGGIVISLESAFIDEARKDILDGNGSSEETQGLKHFSFISAWEDKALLEIIAHSVKVVEL